ncbi:pectinesterase family protein [Isoptericola sp. NPDC019693]|uniref:pectinesterase family protein n=1 Tax=Isoptericola sp. NPDC019693 TaxID=3364009 RepID=UPI0037AF09F1
MPFPADPRHGPRPHPSPRPRTGVRRWVAAVGAPALALTLLTAPGAQAAHGPAAPPPRPPTADALARQTLPAGDGWASAEGGTTGGSAAERIVDVRTRDELVAAVQGDEPKIVRVVEDIDANTRPDGSRISCEDYAVDGYTFEAYLDAFDPAHWEGAASGPLEDARKASQSVQRAQIKVGLGANTTLIGAGDVTLTGFNVDVANVDNVIVRNLRISDAYDCFPGWNGETWKTEWDNLVVSGATHVWLDHLTLDDGETVDAEQPSYFGEKLLRHDGLLDVVRQADLVTISWNRLEGHDKSMLFGNGDGATGDRGKLRVTMHHNELVDLAQRGPRVRFGQVHVYDNVYRVTDPSHYIYSWGVGVESSIVARENTFHLADGVDASSIVGNYGGSALDESGTVVNGEPVDVLAAYNAAHPDAPLSGEVTGSAGPHRVIQPADVAERAVRHGAGSGALHRWQDPTDPAVAGAELVRRIGAPRTTTADGPVWSPTATGFASVPTDELPDGTTGGAGGATVVVRDAAALAEAAATEGPLTVLVQGTLDVEPFGSMIDVASDKTIVGAASGGELVGGGLRLLEVENVIIRNLTFRDSYVAGDWDGKSADNDNDGIRIDTSDHVWIDHNEFARVGDGQLDVRKDSTAVTASWNSFHDHNKTLGVGWTDNVVTTITLHHNRFANVHQRNASLDNVAHGHVYNNWMSGVSSYGINARGGAQVLVENSVFEDARKPLIADGGTVHQRGNVFRDVWGEEPAETGPTFEASAFYPYTADPARKVPALLTRHAGTTQTPAKERLGKRVTVAQDGTGDFLSVHAAVGAASRVDHPVEIVVEPGTYREVVSVWPGAKHLTIRGATGDPADVVVTYDKPDTDWANTPTLTVLADHVTLRDLTLENAYDGAAGPSPAYALRDAGERTALRDVVVLGDSIEGDPR